MIYTKPMILIQGVLLLVAISLQGQIQPTTSDWNRIPLSEISSKNLKGNELQYRLNIKNFKAKLINFPYNDQITSSNRSVNKTAATVQIDLPNLEGAFAKYQIQKLRTMSPELAKKYPSINSYIGYLINDPTTSIHFTIDPTGFNAKVHSKNGSYYIRKIENNTYTITKNDSNSPNKAKQFNCRTIGNTIVSAQQKKSAKNTIPNRLVVLRTAMTATGEYSQYHIQRANLSNSASDQEKKAVVLAAINRTITRINALYENELAITFQLIGNNDQLIFFDPDTDGLTNEDIFTLLDDNQRVIDQAIGYDNYDIGHVLSVDNQINGLAAVGKLCTNEKAKAATQYFEPEGDFFDIDIVAHEIGHQLGANHTFNNDCGPFTRVDAAAIEPGSGSTIMSYAGICSPNIQERVDPYFNAFSLNEMSKIISDATNCGIQTQTINNTPPVIPNLTNYKIPHSTPFLLNTTATDPNTDSLTYCWEQQDNEITVMPPESNATGGPLFRSLPPVASPERYFPPYSEVLAGNMRTEWEVLPSVARMMNFSVTVRDNNPLGGMTAIKNTRIEVAETGPFQITSLNSGGITYDQNEEFRITWNVAGTDGNGINVDYVKILLSYDNGDTFDTVLYEKSQNDGEELILIPQGRAAEKCRIKLEPINNVFYAINSEPFEISNIVRGPKIENGTINIFPNPNNGRFIISFGRFSSEETPILVQVFNLSGKLVYDKTFDATFEATVNLRQQATGMYIVQVIRNNEVVTEKLLLE